MVKVYGPLKKYQRRSKLRPSKVTFSTNLVQRVKQLENSRDKKHIDITYTNLTPGSGGNVIDLDRCLQGTSDTSRVGDTTKPISVTVRGFIDMNAANTHTDAFRVILFLDKENRGASPSISDLLNTDFNSFKNANNTKRFKVLRDKTYALSAGGLECTKFKWYISMNKWKVQSKYVGNNGDTQDFRENHLFIAIIANENTNKTVYHHESRVWFVDT